MVSMPVRISYVYYKHRGAWRLMLQNYSGRFPYFLKIIFRKDTCFMYVRISR